MMGGGEEVDISRELLSSHLGVTAESLNRPAMKSAEDCLLPFRRD